MISSWAAIIIAMWIAGGLATLATKDKTCLGLGYALIGTITTGIGYVVVQVVGKLLS